MGNPHSSMYSKLLIGTLCFIAGAGVMFAYSLFLLRSEWSYGQSLRDRIQELESQQQGVKQ